MSLMVSGWPPAPVPRCTKGSPIGLPEDSPAKSGLQGGSCGFGRITFRIATPCLAGQRASRTDIHALRVYDRIEPLRSIAAALRRLRNRAGRGG